MLQNSITLVRSPIPNINSGSEIMRAHMTEWSVQSAVKGIQLYIKLESGITAENIKIEFWLKAKYAGIV